MKDKYKEYIEYIARDIKPPYIHNMVNQYNLNEDEVVMVLSIIYDRPVYEKDYWIRDYNNGYKLYHESSNEEYWVRMERDKIGKLMMREISPAARENSSISALYPEIDNRQCMKDKYKEYIQFIANDIEVPYHKNMETYGIKQDDYHLVLSELYGAPVSVKFGSIVYIKNSILVYDTNGNKIYVENKMGDWEKYEFNQQGEITYNEDSDGYWYKWEYDDDGSWLYYEDSKGNIEDNRFDNVNNQLYISSIES